MAYSSPATVVTGTTITSAWGNSVKAAADYLANKPCCRVYHNTTQSLTDATLTVLAFNSERFDPSGMHDTVTNNSRITISDAGVYTISGSIEVASAADYSLILADILLNGTTVIAREMTQGNAVATTQSVTVTTLYKFAAGDYVQLRGYQDNTAAAARNVNSSGNHSPEFSAVFECLG